MLDKFTFTPFSPLFLGHLEALFILATTNGIVSIFFKSAKKGRINRSDRCFGNHWMTWEVEQSKECRGHTGAGPGATPGARQHRAEWPTDFSDIPDDDPEIGDNNLDSLRAVSVGILKTLSLTQITKWFEWRNHWIDLIKAIFTFQGGKDNLQRAFVFSTCLCLASVLQDVCKRKEKGA